MNQCNNGFAPGTQNYNTQPYLLYTSTTCYSRNVAFKTDYLFLMLHCSTFQRSFKEINARHLPGSGDRQCDQMTILVFQFWPFPTIDFALLPIFTKGGLNLTKCLPNKPSKIAKDFKNFEKSCHTEDRKIGCT